MAADWWQLRNGWELVDWSLTVDSGGPTEEYGGPRLKRTFIAARKRNTDDEAIALVLALI